jgi:ubiquinone biosynthesis protein
VTTIGARGPGEGGETVEVPTVRPGATRPTIPVPVYVPPDDTPSRGVPPAAAPAPLQDAPRETAHAAAHESARADAAHDGVPLDIPLVRAPRPIVFDPLAPYRGTVRRFFTVYRHTFGLLAGGAVAYVQALPPERRRGFQQLGPRLTAAVARPFLDRELRALPFAVQLRRRLELLGPTYIKFGQILAIREDLLPPTVTGELQNLFDRLPAIPFAQVATLIEQSLGRPLASVFAEVEPEPLGSASIAQAHRARLKDGRAVVVKVIKPGVAEVIGADLRLLKAVGALLERVIPRYQPRRVIAEFSDYTIREVDYRYEADNAETFASNFVDMPDVVFPRIHREASSRDVLTMELLDGFKPGTARTAELTPDERARVIDLGAASIVRMLYQDGFFHADLHAGNLMILLGDPVSVGFIDLGMVGRFEERTRRRMLCYFHALVNGDIDAATRYLTDMATVGPGGDVPGFRRALADLSRRFVAQSRRGDFSIAHLILESVGLGARHAVFFPVEMTLMVKALVTFEGVGRTLDPALDVAAVSRRHVTRIFERTFSPVTLGRELMRSAPEMMDLAVQLPALLTSGFRFASDMVEQRQRPNPLAGLKGTILAAACVIGGVLAFVQGAAWPVYVTLWALALILAVVHRD